MFQRFMHMTFPASVWMRNGGVEVREVIKEEKEGQETEREERERAEREMGGEREGQGKERGGGEERERLQPPNLKAVVLTNKFNNYCDFWFCFMAYQLLLVI